MHLSGVRPSLSKNSKKLIGSDLSSRIPNYSGLAKTKPDPARDRTTRPNRGGACQPARARRRLSAKLSPSPSNSARGLRAAGGGQPRCRLTMPTTSTMTRRWDAAASTFGPRRRRSRVGRPARGLGRDPLRRAWHARRAAKCA